MKNRTLKILLLGDGKFYNLKIPYYLMKILRKEKININFLIQ